MNTKNKSKKGIIGITLAAIMIASIFAILPIPIASNPDECEAQPGELIVDIVTPTGWEDFESCTHFYVDAAIANSNDFNLDGVNVTISISGNAELGTTDETYTKYVGQILSHEVTDVWWELHCTDPGSVKITVTANTTTSSVPNGTDFVWIEQITPPVDKVLIIDIFQYPTETLAESDESGIKATITNIDDTITATDVTAWINLDGNANLVGGIPNNWSVGDIAPGEVEEVGWTMHCSGPDKVYVTVDATADNLDEEQIKEDEVTVLQETPAKLVLEITEPDDGDKFCTNCDYDEFVVTATIKNKGGRGAKDITAHIGTDSGGSHVDIDTPYIKPSVPDYLGPGESATVSWNVTCNDTGMTTFNVTATGYDVKDSNEMKPWDTAYINQKDFIVTIYEPHPSGGYSSCQNFEVKARLQNCKDEVISGINIIYDFRGLGANFSGTPTVWVTDPPKPDWDPSYPMNKLADGIYNVTITDSFCPCCHANLTWYMECLNDTDGTITVNVTQVDDDFTDEDLVDIYQQWKADLAAGIETFAGVLDMTDPTNDTFVTTASDAIPVGQYYTLVVPVTNWGEAAANGVSVSINVDGPATLIDPTSTTQNLRTIQGGETQKAIWTMRCDGKGTVTFKIPTGGLTGNDRNTGVSVLPDNIHIPCPKTIKQIPFTVIIVEPETCTNFTVGDYFTVKANVSNDDPDLTLENVEATLYWTEDSEIRNVTGQPLMMPIGEMKTGKYSKVTWQMQCMGPGEVYMWVKVTSTEPEFTIYSDTVNVHQKKQADVNVKILSPAHYMDTYIATSEEFAVTARISNANDCVDATIYAEVNIDPWDGAHVVSGPDPALPIVLAGGESQVVSWTLHCDKGDWPDDDRTDIEVKVWGTDSAGKDFSVSDWTGVYQYPAAHLEVDISAPDDGSKQALDSEFNITATITNTGEADVWEGKATLSVVPENSILLAEGGYTQDLGTLVGHGEDGSKTVTWTVQCEELGKSTITVTASGNDEFGLVFAKQTTYFEGETCFDGYVDVGAYIEGEMYIDGYFEGGVEVVGGFMDAELWLNDTDIYVHGYFDGEVDGEFNGEIDGTVNATLNGWFCGTIGGGYYCDYYFGTYEGYVDGDFDGYIDTGDYGWFTGNVEGRFKGDIDGLFTGEMFGYVEIGGEISGSKDVCFDGDFNGNLSGWYEGHICGNVDADLNGTVYGYTYSGHYTGWYCDYYKGNIDGSFDGYVDGCFKGEIWDTEFSGYLYGGYVEVYGEVHGVCYIEGYVYIEAYVEGCFWMDGGMTEWTCIEDPGAPIYSGFIEPDSITVKQVTEEDLEEPFDDEIDVQAGWNFISVPKRQDSTKDTFGGLLFGISFSTAYSYDPMTGWTLLTASSPVEVLDGYWINANSAGTITLSYLTGGQMVPPSKDLTGKAWNAIGFSSVTAKSASTTLKSVEGSWSTVIGWDETGQQYEGAIIYEVNDEALMYPGKGYWDWMTADDTLSALSA